MSMEREAILKRLLRSINLSGGDFALLLARCNSIEVRDRLVADLQGHLGDKLYNRHVTEADRVLNLVDILDEVPEGTQVVSITGLEASPHLHDILALANNAREEFRKQFKFPLVLWVTDEVEMQIRRRSPDLASWAAPPFSFGLELDELQSMLERETADVLVWAFAQEGKRGIGQELQWAWQQWQSLGGSRSPELAAKVALVFGIEAGSGEVARSHLENCLTQVSRGSLAAAAHYRLGLWWQLRGKQNRVEFIACCDRSREQLQLAWQKDQQGSVALALGEILLALALEETEDRDQLPSRWQTLANFAKDLLILPDWAAGLRAEVALAHRDWQLAKAEAERALQGQERRGFYLLSWGRSLIGLNQAREAIAPLAEARNLVLPAVDPDLHIRILQALHQAHRLVGNYHQAFTVKCDREGVETSYGFRAFIGAGRLQPRRRVRAIGEEVTEEIATSGRQADIHELVDRVKRSDCRLTIVHGPSGVGKSSLLQSGLVPALRQVIHQSRSVNPVVIEQYQDWRGELASKLDRSPLAPLKKGGEEGLAAHFQEEALEVPLLQGDLGGSDQLIAQLHENDRQNLITVLIFDQFEEFFFKHTEVIDRRKLYDFLRECLAVPYVWLIMSLREDYIHYLLECDRLANLQIINNDILNKNVRYYLGNFSQERAKAVIKELTERSPYRLESALVDRLVADLAAELGEVRPIELQVVGAQMLHGEKKITTLKAYEALGDQPKRALVEGWLTGVVRDCGEENEELAQRVLFALTEEPEKRPTKTMADLPREVRLWTPELAPEEVDLAVQGDLDFVVQVAIGAGLAFEIPASPEVCYQLVHDYLVPPIRRQFGGKLEKQLMEEREKRKEAEANLQKRNRWLLQGSLSAALVMTGLSLVAVGFALQSQKQAQIADEKNNEFLKQAQVAYEQTEIADTTAREAKITADILVWNGLLNAEASTIEDQVEAIEKVKNGTANPEILHRNYRRPVGILRSAINVFREKMQFQGHRNYLNSVAYAPDGKSIVTGSGDKTAKLWSLEGRLLQTFSGHQDVVQSVAYAPDGKSIVTGSLDKTAKLWSLDGRLLQTFSGHQGDVTSVAYAPDGKSIVTASGDKTAKLWSLDGRLLQTFSGHQDYVTSVAYAPDGKSIVTGSRDKTAKLWSLDGNLLQTFSEHDNDVNSVAYAPDGKSIVTGSKDHTAKLWSFDGRLLKTFSGHQDDVYSVAYAPDGKSIVTGSGDKTAKLWNLDGRLLQTFSGHQDYVTSVAYAPDGKSIVTGSRDKTAKLWSLDGRFLPTFSGHQDFVYSAAYAPDGKSIITGSRDETAKLWSLDGSLLQTFSGHQESVYSVAYAPDGQSIVTGSRDKTAKLWSLEGRLLQTFSGHQDYVTSVAYAPDGKSIVTGSRDKTAKLWSLDGRLLQTFSGHQDFVYSVAYAPDGKSIVTGSGDKTAKLWSLDGSLLQTFSGHQDVVQSVAYAPDGKSVVTGSGDKTAKLWSLDGSLLQTFSGHQDVVQSVAYAPDGKSVVTGSKDKTVKLWNLDGSLLQTFSGHQDAVYSVDYAPNGQNIISASSDKTVQVWDLDLDFSLARSCNYLRAFIALANDPSLPEADQSLRQRAKTACEDIPPAN